MHEAQMTAAEIVEAVGTGKLGPMPALEELAARARQVEELEPLLLPLGAVQRKTKTPATSAAIEQVLRVIREASPMRREIVRKLGVES